MMQQSADEHISLSALAGRGRKRPPSGSPVDQTWSPSVQRPPRTPRSQPAGPMQARHESSTDPASEVAEGVEVARLLSMSSLGEQDAIENRLIGRKEINNQTLEASDHQPWRPGARLDRQDLVDLLVAQELERRDFTFEAELRYRRLLHHPAAASDLGVLLEAKGFREEAWQLYAYAAKAREPRALLRLSSICAHRGEPEWARRLAVSASAELDEQTLADFRLRAKGLAATSSSSNVVRRSASLPRIDKPGTTFAFGSFLHVFADRADLARLAYTTALAEGDTMSAMSLLDIAGPPTRKGNRQLHRLLRIADDDAHPMGDIGPHNLAKPMIALRGGLQDASMDELTLYARSRRTEGETYRKEALARISQIASSVTMLRGYSMLDCSTPSHRYVNRLARDVAAELQSGASCARWPGGARLVRYLWDRTGKELELQQSRTQPSEEGTAQRPTPGSGAVFRMRREFRNLPERQLQVLVLKLAGIPTDDVSEVLEQSVARTTQMLDRSFSLLHAGQAGEQLHHPDSIDVLWTEVNDALENAASEQHW